MVLHLTEKVSKLYKNKHEVLGQLISARIEILHALISVWVSLHAVFTLSDDYEKGEAAYKTYRR